MRNDSEENWRGKLVKLTRNNLVPPMGHHQVVLLYLYHWRGMSFRHCAALPGPRSEAAGEGHHRVTTTSTRFDNVLKHLAAAAQAQVANTAPSWMCLWKDANPSNHYQLQLNTHSNLPLSSQKTAQKTGSKP